MMWFMMKRTRQKVMKGTGANSTGIIQDMSTTAGLQPPERLQKRP